MSFSRFKSSNKSHSGDEGDKTVGLVNRYTKQMIYSGSNSAVDKTITVGLSSVLERRSILKISDRSSCIRLCRG